MNKKIPKIACIVMASGEGKRFGARKGGKLLAPLGGVPVLERVLRALPAEEFCKIVVVTRWPEVEALCRRMKISCVRHDRPLRSDTIREGMRAIIGGGLDHFNDQIRGDKQLVSGNLRNSNELGHPHKPDACLFVAGDQPLLTGESVRRMVQTWIQAYSEGRKAVVRLGWKQEAGNPVLFPADMFDALCSLEGNRGGASLLRSMEGKQGDAGLACSAEGKQGGADLACSAEGKQSDAGLERSEGMEVLIVEAGSPYELMDVDTPEALAELAEVVLE